MQLRGKDWNEQPITNFDLSILKKMLFEKSWTICSVFHRLYRCYITCSSCFAWFNRSWSACFDTDYLPIPINLFNWLLHQTINWMRYQHEEVPTYLINSIDSSVICFAFNRLDVPIVVSTIYIHVQNSEVMTNTLRVRGENNKLAMDRYYGSIVDHFGNPIWFNLRVSISFSCVCVYIYRCD